jgi:histone H3/H4
MAATLQETLLAADVRPNVVADCQTLIEQEVHDKSGISGAAIKAAYKTVTAFASGIIHDAVDTLLPDFLDKLQPFYTDFLSSGGADFGDYLAKRGEEVSEALLSVTDERAANSTRGTIKKAYGMIRSSGVKNVETALPRVGALVQKYADK